VKYLVTYDISDNSRRNKLVKLLERYGRRVQFSCFEIEIYPQNLELLVFNVERVIDPETDKVFFYPISRYATPFITKLGVVEPDTPVTW
jgi:CRISPR-associated protein Cas2